MSDRPLQAAGPEDRLGMTDEQWEWFQAYTHGFGEQDENGVDVSLLRENLRLTPSQRVEKMLRTVAPDRVKERGPGESSLQDVLTSLRFHAVRFVVVGGWAVHCFGIRWNGCDLDLCYARDIENLIALVAALAPFHPRLRGTPEGLVLRWELGLVRSGVDFFLATDAGYVDLLGAVPGVNSFQVLWERSQEMELFEIPVPVASLDDLIVMKRAAGRAIDQPYVLELERLRRQATDEESLNRGETKKTGKPGRGESD